MRRRKENVSNFYTYTGYKKPYHLDNNSKKGELLVYVKTDIPSIQIFPPEFPSDIQLLAIKLNFKEHKLPAICIHKPSPQINVYFFNNLSNFTDTYG